MKMMALSDKNGRGEQAYERSPNDAFVIACYSVRPRRSRQPDLGRTSGPPITVPQQLERTHEREQLQAGTR
jgi:hypothetical protein